MRKVFILFVFLSALFTPHRIAFADINSDTQSNNSSVYIQANDIVNKRSELISNIIETLDKEFVAVENLRSKKYKRDDDINFITNHDKLINLDTDIIKNINMLMDLHAVEAADLLIRHIRYVSMDQPRDLKKRFPCLGALYKLDFSIINQIFNIVLDNDYSKNAFKMPIPLSLLDIFFVDVIGKKSTIALLEDKLKSENNPNHKKKLQDWISRTKKISDIRDFK